MKTKKLVTSAMLMTFALMLSLIQLFPLPFGGAVTPVSMLPIIIIGYAYGIGWGLFSAFVYSLLQLIAGINTVSAFFLPGESQMALSRAICVCFIDYVAAYTSLGLGAIFKNRLKNKYTEICAGTVFSLSLRYLMHILSGAIFFGAWAEWFFASSDGLIQINALRPLCDFVMNNVGGNALAVLYSIVYNGLYMIPEIILTAFMAPIVLKIISKTNYIK